MKKRSFKNPNGSHRLDWRVFMLSAMTLLPLIGFADVNLQMQVFREVESVQDDGGILFRREPAGQLNNGDRLLLTIHYRNDSDSPADRVTIENPVPDNAVYQPGGAGGEGASIELSADGGNSFQEEDHINPALVTNIRWVVHDVAPQGEGEVFVRLRVFRLTDGNR